MAEKNEMASGCLAVVGALVSLVYLSNISMGIVEIPDNLPFIGNVDEVFFSGLLFACLARLGINLPVGQKRVVEQSSSPRGPVPEESPPRNNRESPQ